MVLCYQVYWYCKWINDFDFNQIVIILHSCCTWLFRYLYVWWFLLTNTSKPYTSAVERSSARWGFFLGGGAGVKPKQTNCYQAIKNVVTWLNLWPALWATIPQLPLMVDTALQPQLPLLSVPFLCPSPATVAAVNVVSTISFVSIIIYKYAH